MNPIGGAPDIPLALRCGAVERRSPATRLASLLPCPARTALAATALAMLVACGGDDGRAPAPQPNVTAAGAVVTSSDGKVRLLVPANAVSQPALIAIDKVEPDAETLADPLYLPDSSYRITGDLGDLALPATWELTLDAPLSASDAGAVRSDLRRALSASIPPPT